MLAYYYQTKTNTINNEAAFTDYYNNLLRNTLTAQKSFSSLCRICLKGAHSSIYAQKDSKEIIEAMKLFGNIDFSATDESQLLCSVCLKFIRLAISFRKVAVQSDEIYKTTSLLDIKVKFELNDTFDNDQYNNSVAESLDTKFITACNIIPEERRKVPPKVACPICGKVLTKYALKQHQLLHDPNRKKFVCHVCGKTFGLPMSFRRHTMRHRTDFPYKCNLCPYRGQFAELLKSHMRSHTKDYRYMCTECPARFIFISNLNSHMLKHKEPQYKCDTCERSFHTKLNLERHIEYDHLGIKNHVCNICNKAFGNRRARLQHERGVHKREKLLYRRMPSYLKAQDLDKEFN